MKNKLFLLIFTLMAALSSCQDDSVISSPKENDDQVSLRALSQVKLYRYWFKHESTLSDHYWGPEAPSQGYIRDGNKYGYEDQKMYITNYDYLTQLDLYYLSSLNDHILIPGTDLIGNVDPTYGVRQKTLGYIYDLPVAGTVPLKEYYIPVANDHHYVISREEAKRLNQGLANGYYRYYRVLGYVYPDEKLNSEYQPETFVFASNLRDMIIKSNITVINSKTNTMYVKPCSTRVRYKFTDTGNVAGWYSHTVYVGNNLIELDDYEVATKATLELNFNFNSKSYTVNFPNVPLKMTGPLYDPASGVVLNVSHVGKYHIVDVSMSFSN